MSILDCHTHLPALGHGVGNGGGRDLRLEGGVNDSWWDERFMCVLTHTHARGVWGYLPPGKFGKLDALRLLLAEATFGPKWHYSYHCYLYIFACMTLICIDVHMAVAEEPKLQSFQC